MVTLYATSASVDIFKHRLFQLLIMPRTCKILPPTKGTSAKLKYIGNHTIKTVFRNKGTVCGKRLERSLQQAAKYICGVCCERDDSWVGQTVERWRLSQNSCERARCRF